MEELRSLLERIQSCTVCRDSLPHPVRPVVMAQNGSRVIVVGQAPGRRVHDTGIPWNDPSGDRLREWLGVDRDYFYRTGVFALIPMGFCYPGTGTSGDLPPRPECAPLWHAPLWERMPSKRLVLLVGRYARDYYLPEHRKLPLYRSMGFHHKEGLDYLVLPHPSPRNNLWLRKYPVFEEEVLPLLREKLLEVLPEEAG